MINNNIRILFNTAGNNNLGMGHIYTSIRLADKLNENYDVKNFYLLPFDSGPGIEVIEKTKYKYKILESSKSESYIKEIKEFKPDVVINDILYIKEEFMRDLRTLDTLIVNIEHIKEPKSLRYADIIFNSVYPPAITPKWDYYYGPRYVPLKEIFKDLPKKKINKYCKNFYIAFGGSDPSGFTIKAIEALDKLEGITAIILIGAGFNHHKELEISLNKANRNEFNLYDKFNIEYIQQADIGLVSGGNTIYELAGAGVPSIALSHNTMELERLELFSDLGITLNLGNKNLSIDKLFLNVKSFMENYELRKKMSKKQQELVDGNGLDRMIDIIINKLKSKQKINL